MLQLALVMGEAALDAHPNWTIHTIGATGFFLLSMAAQVLRALKPAQGESSRSLLAKRVIAAVNVAILLIDGVLGLLKQPAWTSNLCEWTLAVTVVAFHAVVAYDMSGAQIELNMPAV